MTFLLDTHTLFWSVNDPAKLGHSVRIAIQNPANDRFLSAASVWELAIKVGMGKIALSLPYREWIEKAMADLDLSILPITVEYAERQSILPNYHKDPFDRLIIAQALVEDIPVVSVDVAFDPYGVIRVW